MCLLSFLLKYRSNRFGTNVAVILKIGLEIYQQVSRLLFVKKNFGRSLRHETIIYVYGKCSDICKSSAQRPFGSVRQQISSPGMAAKGQYIFEEKRYSILSYPIDRYIFLLLRYDKWQPFFKRSRTSLCRFGKKKPKGLKLKARPGVLLQKNPQSKNLASILCFRQL